MISNGRFHIYIVDDDDAVRDSLMTVLSLLYRQVKVFQNGSQFLHFIKEAKNDCLILDIHMPLQSGWQVMRELRLRGIRLPTILVTGRAEPQDEKRASRLGAIALLEKPLAHDRLIEAIEQARMMHERRSASI